MDLDVATGWTNIATHDARPVIAPFRCTPAGVCALISENRGDYGRDRREAAGQLDAEAVRHHPVHQRLLIGRWDAVPA
jgi:hypothetical protein